MGPPRVIDAERELPATKDARAWHRAAAGFVLFGGVGVLLLFGASLLGLKDEATAQRWMGGGLHGPWTLPVAMLAFTGLAFLGAPQFVLVGAAVVAFGPWTGFVYSWIGNLISCLLGFYAGRRFGARVLREHAGPGVSRLVQMIGRNGFWASLIVRLVPSAPFIVVNMAAGATPMKVLQFLAGTAVGSTPKIALTAFAGDAVVGALRGGGALRWLSLAAAAAVWIAAGLAARAWLQREEQRSTGGTQPPQP